MKVAGFTLGNVVKIGAAAVLFILAFKLLANRSGIPALQSFANAI
jgi:F0F1-type ATP synthase assembly protein I